MSPLTRDTYASPLVDACGRRIDHLRLSVTSACNLRCLYCRPRDTSAGFRASTNLSDAQRVELISFLHRRYALRQVRLTGGEPLLHSTIAAVIAAIREAAPAISIAMTTNGWRLAELARPLREAGLDRLNVSLDSLDPARYRRLTGGRLQTVLDGLERALEAGFPPPRLNVVALRGHNDTELGDIAAWGMSRGMEVRFLEAMPIGPAGDFNRSHFVSGAEIRCLLERRFRMTPEPRLQGDTASRFIAADSLQTGVVGLICPVSAPFCGECRRIRITADGQLFPCLLDSHHVDLRPAWERDALDEAKLQAYILLAIKAKQERGRGEQRTTMIRIGG